MVKKYLFFIFSVMLPIILFTSWTAVTSADTWIIKSKDQQPFVIWMTGMITRGDPNDLTTDSSRKINLSGIDYFSAPKWFKNGDAVYCPWGNKPIVYKAVPEERGAYRIGLSVKNFASSNPEWTKPDGYKNFNVNVYVNGKKAGSLKIEASDTDVKTAYLDKATNIESGPQKIEFVWTNDQYKPGKKQDANIEIHNVHLIPVSSN